MYAIDSGGGANRIFDFSASDKLEFSALGISFADLSIADDPEGDAVVSAGPGDSVELLGVSADTLSEADNFLF